MNTPVLTELTELTADGPRKRVLVVDDDGDAAALLSVLLNRLGYESRYAEDPATAIATARTFRPEVAVLDIGLPGMDGCALASHLRDEAPEHRMKLVALTGRSDDDSRRSTEAAGFDAHLVKGVELGVLLSALGPPAVAA